MSDQLYKEFILDLYRNPLHKKLLDTFDAEYTEYNATCGDEISIQLLLDDEGKVCDIGHQGQGCAISQAAVSLMTDFAIGKSAKELLLLNLEDVTKEMGVNIDYTREKCAMIGLTAIQHALQISSKL
jgi:nitrogen fixation NifU-like protein